MGMGFVCAILSSVLFGLMPMMTKEIYLLGGNPLSVSVYRFLFSVPFLLFQSYEYISSGMATTIHFIYPVLVLLGSILFFRERLTWQKGICTGLCLAGMLCFIRRAPVAAPWELPLLWAPGSLMHFTSFTSPKAVCPVSTIIK